MTEYNLVAEEYGGDTIFVNVSAKTGEGIKELIDSILLTADAVIDLQAVADDDARGVAIKPILIEVAAPLPLFSFNVELLKWEMPSLPEDLSVAFVPCSTNTARPLLKPDHLVQCRYLVSHLFLVLAIHSL